VTRASLILLEAALYVLVLISAVYLSGAPR